MEILKSIFPTAGWEHFSFEAKLLVGRRAKSLATLLIRTIHTGCQTSILHRYMSATLRLVQLNIEKSKHLELVTPFLRVQEPDVVCLQELMEHDVLQIEKELGMQCVFAPMSLEQGRSWGVGIFSRLKKTSQRAMQYGGSLDKHLLEYVHGNRREGHASSKFMLIIADIEKEGETFRIGTTHFPVTEKGEVTDFQREDMKKMLELLKEEGEFVLTGDFNAPRGGEIFAMLAKEYKDNVPPHYTTSIDGNIHRAGHLEDRMVDGIFSTPSYEIKNVTMHSGVSDHCAISAEAYKN